MKRSKKNLMALALASVIGVSSLTGCVESVSSEDSEMVSDVEEEVTEEEVTEEEVQSTEVQEGDTKVFEPYTHVFFVRVYNDVDTTDVKGGQVEVPEGYEILDIEPWTQKYGYGARTPGYDVWFINNKTVEATAVYNDATYAYDYSAPGTVIELTNEESGPSKTLTP